MEIRPATPADGPGYVELVQCLADFENLPSPDLAATQRLLEHAFADAPFYRLWVAAEDRGIVAYAAWFLTYSTFRALPTLYLEDLFVHPSARRRGLATQILERLREEATTLGCGRMEWSVLDWNKDARNLYDKVGARTLDGWLSMRIDLEAD